MHAQVMVAISCSPTALRNQFIERYRDASRKKIGGAIWLAPTREAVDEVRQQIGTMLAPLLFDWPRLARHIIRQLGPSVTFASANRHRILLQEAIAQVHREKRLGYFGGIGDSRGLFDSVAGLIEEIHEQGNTTSAFLSAAAAISGQEKQQDIRQILQRYASLLEEQNLVSPGETLRLAVERLRSTHTSPFAEVDDLFVDHRAELLGQHVELLEQLGRYVKRLWIGQIDEPGENREELFRVGRRTCEAIRHQFKTVNHSRVDESEDAPSGLKHLRRALFSEAPPPPAADVAGLSFIEAPGPLGEARMVARQIRQLLASDVRPESIVVTARNLAGNRDLIAEVFDEYRVPFDIEGDEPFASAPLLQVLLRAARLPEENWPFAGVTALLRNTFFRPSWPDCTDADVPRHAEALLRMLGQPEGDRNVLRAVKIWAETPPPSLEDEQAEESRRRRKIELARKLQPFLQSFFRAWEGFRSSATLAHYTEALREFAKNLRDEAEPDSQIALDDFLRELDDWVAVAPANLTSRAAFLQTLHSIAAGPRRTPRSAAGKVRVRGADSAAALSADYLFVLGLGENSFPDLSPRESLLDDADRERLGLSGLTFRNPADRLPAEMLLFYRLIAVPRRQLTLSYPAVDAKGQPLLPSSFLRAVRDCFADQAIAPERRRMLLDDYFNQPPIAEAEQRVQFAAAMHKSKRKSWRHAYLDDKVVRNLSDAARVAAERFNKNDFGPFDGWLTNAAIAEQLRKRFGPSKPFSPTALETYIACPFRFFLGKVLRLEELDEPREEVQPTSRGLAFHRALSRFHGKHLQENRSAEVLENLNEDVSKELQQSLDTAIQEYQKRFSTDAGKVLWELESLRLKRNVARYHEHWDGFVLPWRKEKNAVPTPAHLEADFGLPAFDSAGNSIEPTNQPLIIRVNDIEVRIAGRIDRVDIAQLDDEIGFWIVDYKTGAAKNYTGSGLKNFEKLQLSLYALAVQRVLYDGKKARPLGLAYWLVTDTGPKHVLPGSKKAEFFSWFEKPENWDRFSRQLEEWVATLASNIREGRFPLAPRSETCAEHCPYNQVCRITQSRATGKSFGLELPMTNNAAECDE